MTHCVPEEAAIERGVWKLKRTSPTTADICWDIVNGCDEVELEDVVWVVPYLTMTSAESYDGDRAHFLSAKVDVRECGYVTPPPRVVQHTVCEGLGWPCGRRFRTSDAFCGECGAERGSEYAERRSMAEVTTIFQLDDMWPIIRKHFNPAQGIVMSLKTEVQWLY
jgi:hypothetical protein